MIQHYDPRIHCLPSSAELPDSDDTPVDNELQEIIPHLLRSSLALAWSLRNDWFFGVDMGIYYAPSEPAIVPDGFLSLGVERLVQPPQGRLSYVFWEEDNVPPVLALEVVSKTYGREYEAKQRKYAELGILYYLIYSVGYHPRRQRDPFEMYKLVDGQYARLSEDYRVWMPEVGLAIGREVDTHQGWHREWLYWYDQAGNRLPTPEEFAAQERQIAAQERQRADAEQQRANRLAEKLRELGVDPENLSG